MSPPIDKSFLARVHAWTAPLLMAGLLCAIPALASPAATAGEALHVLNRVGFGPRPGDLAHVQQVGVQRYIDEQLDPQRIALPAGLAQRLDALSADNLPDDVLLARYAKARMAMRAAQADMPADQQALRTFVRQTVEHDAQARLVRALYSPRQLEEVMVDFWFNHFNVFAGKGLVRVLAGNYERDAIRPYALGNFRDLLGATAAHPAMLFYLDNWMSTAAAPAKPAQPKKASGLNENYARELMELHTLGVDGGYTQQDVTELARIFTGWTFNQRGVMRNGAVAFFDGKRHDWGEKQWLGRRIGGAGGSGREEGEQALDILAAHPATARHISHQLAQYFVGDRPPKALVDSMARRFLATRGDIRAVLRTLFDSPEFRDPQLAGAKFKTPYRYVVSALRAADLPVANVRPLLNAMSQLGMPLHGCPTPDGYRNTEEAWANADAITRRINFATALAGGRLQLANASEAPSGVQDVALPPVQPRPPMPPLDSARLVEALGPTLSAATLATIGAARPELRAALVLGGPDFMRY